MHSAAGSFAAVVTVASCNALMVPRKHRPSSYISTASNIEGTRWQQVCDKFPADMLKPDDFLPIVSQKLSGMAAAGVFACLGPALVALCVCCQQERLFEI